MAKKNIIITLFAFLLLSCQFSFGQTNNIRGLYLSGINSWLGNTASETAILNYAQGNSYTYITLYDLGSLNFNNSATKNALASFISRAKTQYGLSEIGAAGEIASFFSTNIIPYNNGRSQASEKFDVLNFEFEFWLTSSISSHYCNKYLSPNGYSCDTAGAYKFAKAEMLAIAAMASANGLTTEMYMGWPNTGQMQFVANTMNRILLHAYRPNDADVYQYSRNRLIDIASVGHPVTVIPLFSAEPAYMGSWLNSHALTQPYQTYESFYATETGTWKQNIKLQGYQWFTYAFMPKTVPTIATITASGPTTFCTGGSVTLNANTGSAYLWSPGGQTTASIAVTQSGSYTVRVTSTSGNPVTSAPLAVTVSTTSAIPIITASGSLTLGTNNPSVTLTSSTATTYSWSNGATTQSITISTAGSYNVTVNGSTACAATSASLTVSTGACIPPPTPIITANGSLNLCQGSSVSLTSSSANGYLWSTGATSQSISVNTAGTYWVRAYVSGNCSTQSLNTVITLLPLSTPTISVNGSLSLTTSNPSVTLSSSTGNLYSWSTGATSQSINVSAAGTYQVTVTAGNGCAATSAPVTVTKSSCTPPPIPVITLNRSPILHPGQTVTLTSSQASGYLWSTGAVTRSIVVSRAGTYSVRNYSGSNCYSVSSPVYITSVSTFSTTKVDNLNFREFTVYPNPATDQLNFSYMAIGEEEVVLILFDITGREMINRTIHSQEGENKLELPVSEYPRGVYFANLISKEEKRTIKLILQ